MFLLQYFVNNKFHEQKSEINSQPPAMNGMFFERLWFVAFCKPMTAEMARPDV